MYLSESFTKLFIFRKVATQWHKDNKKVCHNLFQNQTIL